MDTTRNAETPTTEFGAKTSQKWPEKLPNVTSEILEKDTFLRCLWRSLQRATALLMDTTGNAETPPNFAPKTSQKWPEKLPNVTSEILEKTLFFSLPLA